MPSTTIADLARLLGITQTAAARHAKAVGGADVLAAKVQENLNHILAGGSRRTAPGGLPGFMTAAVEATAEGKTAPTFTTRKPKVGHTPRDAWKQRQPPTREEESAWSDEFLCPTSSNVYSFQQHQVPGAKTATLYVTFRAAVFKGGSFESGTVTHKGRTSGRQLKGTGGVHATGWARPFSPGARYAYYNTPPDLFQKMKDSYSRGKFVWDKLRVRGTIHGHQYAYSLVSAQVLPGAGGAYVPRRATKSGFKTRTLAEAGTGRRGFVTSTLPASANGGFTTRRGPK